jgi:hypothetical protein
MEGTSSTDTIQLVSIVWSIRCDVVKLPLGAVMYVYTLYIHSFTRPSENGRIKSLVWCVSHW